MGDDISLAERKRFDDPVRGVNSPLNVAMTALMFGGMGLMLADRPFGPRRGSIRAYLPPKVRDKKRRRREIAKASRKRNRH